MNETTKSRMEYPGSTPRRKRSRFPSSVAFFALCSCLGFFGALSSSEPQQTAGLDFVLGTWTGTSTCVGNRPACKNETVVYRVLPVDGHPTQVRWLGDKIIEGKRLPMGALIFDVDEQSRSLRCEFTVNQTHGVWSFKVNGDSMTGTLENLPDKSIGRDVKVRRAKDNEVPEAPPLSDYGD